MAPLIIGAMYLSVSPLGAAELRAAADFSHASVSPSPQPEEHPQEMSLSVNLGQGSAHVTTIDELRHRE